MAAEPDPTDDPNTEQPKDASDAASDEATSVTDDSNSRPGHSDPSSRPDPVSVRQTSAPKIEQAPKARQADCADTGETDAQDPSMTLPPQKDEGTDGVEESENQNNENIEDSA